MKNDPPKLLRWFFHCLCPRERRAEIEGDFNEVYEKLREEKGRLNANLNYFRNALSMLNFEGYLGWLRFSNFTTVLRATIRGKFRSIVRFRLATIISLITLSLGAVTSGFLFYYIHYEYSYDGFHQGANNIYRVNSIAQNDRGEQTVRAVVPLPAGPKMLSDFDEVVNYARLQRLQPTVTYQNNSFEELNFFLTDNSFFELFSFPIVKGNSISPLAAPQTVVLTESMALKYFGEQNPIGEVIHISTKKSFSLNFTDKSFTVSAIVQDAPKNSHIQYDFLASLSTLGDFKADDWLGGLATYVRLTPEHNVDLVNQKFDPLIRENLGPHLQARFGMSYEDYLKSGRNMSYYIQPIAGIHHAADIMMEFEEGVDRSFLHVLLSVATLILLLTTVNFFNITFANGLHRLKEMGIRKSMGAFKHQVFSLLLLESLALGLFSLFIAAVLTLMSSPLIEASQIDLPTDFIYSSAFILSVTLTTILICLASGLFIATRLSKVSARRGLSGSLLKGQGGLNLQKFLLSLQFFVAFVTLMAAVVFQIQNSYLLQSDLGFDQSKLLIVKNMEMLSATEQNTLRSEWLNSPRVASVSFSYQMPGKTFESLQFKSLESSNRDEPFLWSILATDDDFLATYGLEIIVIDERNRLMQTDSSFVLINESAMRALGLLDATKVMDKKLDFYGKTLNIKGVVSDFHYQSLYNTIEPLVLMSPKAFPEPSLNPYRYASLRTSDLAPDLLDELEKKWRGITEAVPFGMSYLENDLKTNYESELRLSALINGAGFVAILVAILGLMSMSQVIFRVKVKEIAMRKVLGATHAKLYQFFVNQFFWPLCAAFIFALPLVIVFLKDWLNKFAYRITLEWQLFALTGSGLVLLAIGILTINGLRAARQNPVKYISVDH